MATVREVMDALRDFGAGIEGIKKSYGLKDVVEKPGREIPCLVVVPMADPGTWNTIAFIGNAPSFSFDVMHLLLFAPTANLRLAQVWPDLIDMLDTYLAALKAEPFLGSTTAPPIHNPTIVTPSIGIVIYGDLEYHAIEFRHKVQIYL